MNTLYILIDNNSLSERYNEDIKELDCHCINDFCSLIGYTVIGDLKDENGKPFTQVGSLLLDFKKANYTSFETIIQQWYGCLCGMLQNGIQGQNIFKLPQEFVNWLVFHEIDYYVSIGKKLQENGASIVLDSQELYEDIIPNIINKIKKKISETKFDNIAFSDYNITAESFIVKELNKTIEDFSSLFMKRVDWERQLKEKTKEQISTPNIDDEPEKPALLEEKDVIIKVKDVSFKMIFVKGGTFTMGATYEQGSSAESRERPNHIVTLSNYFIGETVVTQALWTAIMGDNPSEFKGLNYPVQRITWYRSQEFINKLNSLTGHNFRLPTEAEWEFAARGGVKSKNYKYAGSNNINEVGWYYRNTAEGPHPVAQKKPNELGLFDMSGNVHEWCNDWYGKYESSSQNNPKGPTFGNKKVARGGFWNASDCVSRVTCRRRWNPSSHGFSFRLALSFYNNTEHNDDNDIIAESSESSVASNDDMNYRENGWPIDGDWPWYCP